MTGPGASAEYEVTALRYGTRTARKSEVFLHFEVYGEPDRELAMDYFVWVARNADRTVLIDCGFNERSGARRNRTMLCPPVEALRRIGVDVAAVSQLIVTHAHYDHIGGHTPGQLAVIVGTARGETVIASDTLHYYEEMAQDRPFAHVTDVPAMYAGFAWLREQAAAGHEIVAGHDPQVMQRYPAVAGAARLAVRVG